MYEYEFRDRLVSGTYRDAFRAPAGTGKPHRVVPHRQVPPGRKRDRCERRKKGWRTHGSQSGNPWLDPPRCTLGRPVVGVGKGDRGRHTRVGRRWSVRGTPWLELRGESRVPTFSNRLEALEIRFERLMIGGSGRSSAPSALGLERRNSTFPVLPIRGTKDTKRRDPVSASEPQKRLGVPLIYELIKWHWFSYQDIGIQSRIHQTAAHRDFEAKSYALVMLAGR
ncbi:hypothetical protein G5I_11139 [Acromyrmex echinatior]|uniref:Uncharacterized protein n=1 Tax=Acromyrmex echinatior TaxID=103372 RepID=F4WYS5_ACREC|nr:hypothetical protein G5I_11139 [Acromyrmex echinatior]